MKFKIIGFLTMLLALILFSCKPRELPKEKEVVMITKTVMELKRDTIVQVKADSSFYEALIECQNGKPVLLTPSNFKETKSSEKAISGKNLQPPNVTMDDEGKLKISCQYLANQLKITLREKQVLEQKLNEKTIVPPPVEIEKELTWWQKLFITIGRFVFFGSLVYLVFKVAWKVFLKS